MRTLKKTETLQHNSSKSIHKVLDLNIYGQKNVLVSKPVLKPKVILRVLRPSGQSTL